MTRKSLAAFAATLSLVAFAFTALRAESDTPELPDTAPGKLMGEWIQLFNRADASALEAFVKAHYGSGVLKGRAPGEIAHGQLRMRAGGELTLAAVDKSTPNELVAIWASGAVLPQFIRVTWRVEEDDPQRIAISSISPAEPPKSVQATPLPVDQLTRELDGKLEELTKRNEFSGAVLIAKGGKPVWQKAYGLANRERKIPATVDTRFRLGSMNKMFTSVAIAQLVEGGKLKFTDTLADVLPDYPNKEIARKITIAQLLTHTSGLGDIFTDKFDERKDQLRSLKDYLPLFANDPLEFEPGKGWSYSNAGFLTLGLVVEKVSGEDYYDYIQHHIYDVAGMKSSGDIPKDKRPDDLAVGYIKQGDKLEPNWDTLPWRGMSAGGGDSTLGDLLKFANALRENKLVSAAATETITTGKVEPGRGFPGKYAYGFMDDQNRGRRVVGHGGGAPGMNARMSIVWQSGYTVVVLANLDPPAADNVANYILDRLAD